MLDENVIRKHDITSQMNLKELLAQEAENRNPNRQSMQGRLSLQKNQKPTTKQQLLQMLRARKLELERDVKERFKPVPIRGES